MNREPVRPKRSPSVYHIQKNGRVPEHRNARNSTAGGVGGRQSHGRGRGGAYKYRFFGAASEAGMQGAQPLPGGLGVSPQHTFSSFARFAAGETRKRNRIENVPPQISTCKARGCPRLTLPPPRGPPYGVCFLNMVQNVEEHSRGCRGTQSHGRGFGGVPRPFLPPYRPAAGGPRGVFKELHSSDLPYEKRKDHQSGPRKIPQ